MIPVTRKELYLNKIVGNNDYSIPEKPISEEEFFFAEILGEAVQAPEPLPRYQMYLAKIAGRNIDIPYPKVRLEYFLAKAAGMDITVPVPITREEIYWSNYTAIVEFEIENVPPLTYKAIEGTLKNYHIYGNTVNGESVGDKTGNLFDGEVEQGSFHGGYGEEMPSTSRIRTTFYTKSIPAGTYTINAIGVTNVVGYSYTTNNINSWDSSNSFTGWKELPYTFTLSAERFMRFAFKQSTDISVQPSDISNIMLNAGSIPLPYEPYGYKVQIAVTNSGTTSNETIYLPEPIKMVGSEAEYVDYAEQKMHRIGADDLDVTLPALPTLTGTNVLSVGTAVQPSKVYVKYKGERQ